MDQSRQAVTTCMVHRRDRNKCPWWRCAAICDLPGSLDNDDLQKVAKFLPDIADLGFQGVLIRPANPRVDKGLPWLKKFVKRAHKLGLRVLVRAFLAESELDAEASPPLLALEHDSEELTQRARAILRANADGVDLGLINDQAGSPDAAANFRAFTQAVQLQLAQVEMASDETILTAAIIADSPETSMRHLTENWFHHLRDNELVTSPWQVDELQRRVRQVFLDRDPLGHTAAWRYSLPKWTSSPLTRNSENYGWAKSRHGDVREVAMMLYAVSLPGAVYVPFLHVGGGVKAKKDGLKFTFGRGRMAQARASVAGEALALRNRLSLGDATLAFVDGLPWAGPDVSVHLSGPIMVVLNTGKDPVVVPSEHQAILSSRGIISSSEAGTIVRPNYCVWFRAAEPEPAKPTSYR